MGTALGTFIQIPIAAAICALCYFAIIFNKQQDDTKTKWTTFSAIGLCILLIIVSTWMAIALA